MITANSPTNIDKKLIDFFLQNLSGEGLNELDLFQNNLGIFELCDKKKIENPLLFWNLAEPDCPNLSVLASKLLRIPAASAQIERAFSSWGFVHSDDAEKEDESEDSS